MKHVLLTLIPLLLLAGPVPAQAPDESKKGLPEQPSPNPALPVAPAVGEPAIDSDVNIGSKAPDFTMDGSQGRQVRLSDLAGQWAVMVFTDDRAKLKPLGPIDADVRKLGARLYGIAPDAAEALKTYAERERIPFLLLSDLTGEISQLYGMYDFDNDVILPGVVLMDPKGVVRMIVLGPALHGDEVLRLVRHTLLGA